ncbi:Irc10p [Saccharomyces paradoxus]|uniref:Irc10p n=1 Tax=Saccharomyces paradoxus TaxID=27291 RepID=A0A8B8UZE4_SACPA|nr:Irc10 [Saccharomyces paradoxus]QHS76105.1 Irc10 [Saccharomyces paradoxus]
MFIEYSRLPGFESINVSFSKGMLRLARFTNFATYEQKLEYFKLLAGPNKYIERISAGDFKGHPDEISYIYIILISVLQIEECMPVLVQCPTVYWIRFDWPGKCSVNNLNFTNETLRSAFDAVFTPYSAIMKKVLGRIKNNMLLFAEPQANLNNLFVKHFHDLIYNNVKDEKIGEAILYLRTNVNIPNVFVNNSKAVFHGDGMKIGKFTGKFLSFTFKRTIRWSKLNSVDSFTVTRVNYRVSVNWEKTPRKVFLSLDSDTKNLRYISKTKLNKKGNSAIIPKTTKSSCTNENLCDNEAYSVEFPLTTSAKTEYLLKSDFFLQKIDKKNSPTLQELTLNGTYRLHQSDFSNEQNVTQRKYEIFGGIVPTNAGDKLLTFPRQKATRDTSPSSTELAHTAVAASDGSALKGANNQSIAKTQCVNPGIGKIISRKTANWICSNPAPDPYAETSTWSRVLAPNLKTISESTPYYPIHIASPNSTFNPEQSTRSIFIRSSSECVQKQSSFFRNYEHLRNILSRRTSRVRACCSSLNVGMCRNKGEILLQKQLTLPNKTREKVKRFRHCFHRAAEALRAAKKNWDQHNSSIY